MKVLITGAKGRLGSQTIEAVHDCQVDCEIIATDIRNRQELPGDYHEMSLLDEQGVIDIMQGVDWVVHLGNYTGTGWGHRTNTRTFNENVAMNQNVFDAAVNAGVKKIVFASSIQVIASEDNYPVNPPHAKSIAYLPLDAYSPANPTNCYSLSKMVGEQLLDHYVQHFGIECASLRLPMLFTPGKPSKNYRPFALNQPTSTTRIAQAFAMLSYPDAARAIVAVLTSHLRGHRIYLPAKSEVRGPMVRPAVEKLYRNVPLRQPLDQIDELIDHWRITEETGWLPRDPVESIMPAA